MKFVFLVLMGIAILPTVTSTLGPIRGNGDGRSKENLAEGHGGGGNDPESLIATEIGGDETGGRHRQDGGNSEGGSTRLKISNGVIL